MNTNTQNYTDTDMASFAVDVIEASKTQLVMVDFWADWCGPCKSLGPILENLVVQYQGAVKLVKVNSDQQQDLAAQFGIRSLPTVFFFKNGEVVDQFMGAQPESAIREIIDKHNVNEIEAALTNAQMAYDNGQTEEAKAFMQQVIAHDPDNDKPKLMLLGWLCAEGAMEDAKFVADTVSEAGQSSAQYKGYIASEEMAKSVADLPDQAVLQTAIEQDPDNLEARLQLSQWLVAKQDYAAGLEHLLEIIKRDRSYNEDAARLMMIKVFELLGGKGEVVTKYRSQLSRLLN